MYLEVMVLAYSIEVSNRVCGYNHRLSLPHTTSSTHSIVCILSLHAGVWKRFKYCAECGLIMVERAKWKDFDAVKYCSDRCRSTSKTKKKQQHTQGEQGEQDNPF